MQLAHHENWRLFTVNTVMVMMRVNKEGAGNHWKRNTQHVGPIEARMQNFSWVDINRKWVTRCSSSRAPNLTLHWTEPMVLKATNTREYAAARLSCIGGRMSILIRSQQKNSNWPHSTQYTMLFFCIYIYVCIHIYATHVHTYFDAYTCT